MSQKHDMEQSYTYLQMPYRLTNEELVRLDKYIEFYCSRLNEQGYQPPSPASINSYKNKKEGQIALYTLYASRNIPLGTQYDIVFDEKDKTNFWTTKAIIRHSIWNSSFPSDGLEQGHKHVCIFEFPDGVPSRISNYITETEYNLGKRENYLGLCSNENWFEIQKYS